jgi:lauroyl/myristoyl acyltransferase
MGMLLSLTGYRLTGIRDRNEGAIRSYMQQTAGRKLPEFSAVQILFSDDFPREIFRCFRENRLVVSALDINRSRGIKLKTCPVRIFGDTREFLTGTMQIAMRCGATIIPAFLVSRSNFYYRIVFLPPLYAPGLEADGEHDCSLPNLMQGYADAIEQYIRKYPDHLSKI